MRRGSELRQRSLEAAPRRGPRYFLPLPPFLPFALPFFFVAFLCFGQPVTAIFVLSWISAPFCPTKAVGIASFDLQRVPLAARAEYLPSGSVNSKLPTGTSGTVLNVELVIPAFEMNVVPTRSTVVP